MCEEPMNQSFLNIIAGRCKLNVKRECLTCVNRETGLFLSVVLGDCAESASSCSLQ